MNNGYRDGRHGGSIQNVFYFGDKWSPMVKVKSIGCHDGNQSVR